jgi:hypothetical protein
MQHRELTKGELIMTAWQTIARLLSGSSVLPGLAMMIDSGLVELTAAQLDQVAGGGGHPNIGSGGSGAGTNLLGGALGGVIGSAANIPDGGTMASGVIT